MPANFPAKVVPAAMAALAKVEKSVWVYALIGLMCGALVAKANVFLAVAVFGGAAGIWAVQRWPVFGIWLLIAGTTFIPTRTTLPGTDIVSVHFLDALLVYLLLVMVVRILVGRASLVITPMMPPVLVFVGVGIVMMLVSRFIYGVHLLEALLEGKVVLYYLTALLVPNFVRSPRTARLLAAGCLGIGVLMSFYLLGSAILLPPETRLASGEAFHQLADITGHSEKVLMYWFVCCVGCLLVVHKVRALYLVMLVLGLGYFVLTFHRHMYIALGLAAVCIPALTYRWRSGRLVTLTFLLVALLVAGATLTMWGPAGVRHYAELTVMRVTSLKGIEKTDTVVARQFENRHAIQTIGENPVTGMGFARPYRPKLYGPDDTSWWFVHNGYLWILLKMGLLGMIPFCIMVWRYLRGSLGLWHGVEDQFLQAIVLGSAITFIGLLVVNLVAPYFMQSWGVATIGLMIGLLDSLQHRPAVSTR